MAREFFPGVGEAVAARTILRPGEGWGDVARRVAAGNESLDYETGNLEAAIADGRILLSGRHLQHGDENQRERPMEVFTNCSTASQRALLFYLLLNGSGVGTSYDDDMCVVDWNKMPKVIPVLSANHPDYTGEFEAIVPPGAEVFVVPDSREGWAQAVQHVEDLTFMEVGGTIYIDFSLVREKGAPIRGMQDRPSSGPVPLMQALVKFNDVAQANYPRWRQAMELDHLLAEIVLVGGARRAARIAVKWWGDPDIHEFINIKQAAGLWTANNSVGVDADFWQRVRDNTDMGVFRAIVEAQYRHGTGEPGFLNMDLISRGETANPDATLQGRFKASKPSEHLRNLLAQRAANKPYPVIVNPCVPAETPILTDQGYVAIGDVIGQEVNVWNGFEFSAVTPFATGFNPTVVVKLSDGSELRCTPTHKFVLKGNVRVEAGNLVGGETLEKFSMPVVENGWGQMQPRQAYTQGFYSGDGNSNMSWSWVYATKYSVMGRLLGDFKVTANDTYGRVKWVHGQLKDKTFVPVDACRDYCINWLAGLLDSDGAVLRDKEGGQSFQISSVDKTFLNQVQLMLTRLGVTAKISVMKEAQTKAMPGGFYDCKTCYRLIISGFDAYQLHGLGLSLSRLDYTSPKPNRSARRFVEVLSVTPAEPCETFCFTEPKNHTGTFNGIVTGQCGEIRLSVNGGYCVIGDIALAFCKDQHQFNEAVALVTRSLIRTNLMPAMYQSEVDRTNRIGVALTGIHEYAWSRFGLTFHDLVAEGVDMMFDGNGNEIAVPAKRALPFWHSLMEAAHVVNNVAGDYCEELSVEFPTTLRTIKPAGTTSKLFGLTEGAHLPSMREYLRWVQFRSDSPMVEEYLESGYPVRDLETYKGTSIVGFPTRLLISDLMGPNVVTATEATPEQQIRWIRLIETYWLLSSGGNQVSYTLKYDPKVVNEETYAQFILDNVPLVRAVSIMPQIDSTAYEYQPEEPITAEQYEDMMRIIDQMAEDVGLEHVDCASGACPVDFKVAEPA